MKPKDLIEHFGGVSHTATAMNVSRQAVHNWLSRRRLPQHRQWQAELVTAGKLKSEKKGAI